MTLYKTYTYYKLLNIENLKYKFKIKLNSNFKIIYKWLKCSKKLLKMLSCQYSSATVIYDENFKWCIPINIKIYCHFR